MKSVVQAILISSALFLAACSGNDSKIPMSGPTAIDLTKPWVLDRDQSGMTYVTIKNNAVAEINTFRSIDGRVTPDGQAEFTVVLDSVDTSNEIRDPRMREFLFETASYPYAKVTAQLDISNFTDLAIGERHTELLNARIDLHGVTDDRSIYVMVTRINADTVLVENKAPLLLDAADFGFTTGLDKLQELAGLASITPIVPVTFSLVFTQT